MNIFLSFRSMSMNKTNNVIAQREYHDAILSQPNELFSSRLDTPVHRHEKHNLRSKYGNVIIRVDDRYPAYLLSRVQTSDRVTAVPASETKLYAQRIADLYLDSYLSCRDATPRRCHRSIRSDHDRHWHLVPWILSLIAHDNGT